MSAPREEKVCATCGRPFAWRAKWRDVWDEVRYCSARCRSEKPGRLDRAIERALIDLLAARRPDSSVCPSEVARAVDPEGWRPLMPRVRRTAARLAKGDVVRATRGERRVHPEAEGGPIRLRRGDAFASWRARSEEEDVVR